MPLHPSLSSRARTTTGAERVVASELAAAYPSTTTERRDLAESPDAGADALRRILARRDWSVRLPPSLAPAFERHRERDLARYVRIAAAPLASLVLGLTALQTYGTYERLGEQDARLWRFGAAYVLALVLGGCALVQTRAVQRRYEWLAASLGALVLTKLIIVPHVFRNAEASESETYFCAITAFIVTVGLRLRPIAAGIATLVPVSIASFVIPFVATRPTDWLQIAYSLGAPALVGAFVALQIEQKDKLGFLQETLLVYEAGERERLNSELDRLAHVDPLSGLANRREFDRRVVLEWERQRRDRLAVSVLFVDIDHFKSFNDLYGHAAGDAGIASIARAVREACTRPSDLVARYGGEEFVVLLPETDALGALVVAQRIVESVRAAALPHAGSSVAPHATVSVGVATEVPRAGRSPSVLLERADRALYRAKRAGRDQVASALEIAGERAPA